MPTRIAGFVFDSSGAPVNGATVTPRASDGSTGTTGVTNAAGYFAIAGLADKIWAATVATSTQRVAHAVETLQSDDIHNQSNTLSAHDFSQLRGKAVAGQINSESASAGTVLTANGTGGATWATSSGGIGGSTGSNDNRVLRADGTGGATLQASAVTIDDSGNVSGVGTVDGRDLSVDGAKLDGIEAGADVTDAANVDAAGAVMNSDISANGHVVRTGSGTYTSRSVAVGSGNHLTVSNGDGVSGNPTLDLATKHRTRTALVTILNPANGDDVPIEWFPNAATITEVYGCTDTGTATIQVTERVRTAPFSSGTDVLTSSLVPDSNGETTTSFSNSSMAADSVLVARVTATASSPTKLLILVEYTID